MSREDFLLMLQEALELDDLDSISMESVLDELEEWDSVGQLTFLSLVDEKFDVELDTDKMGEADTLSELYEFVTKSVS